MENWFALPAEKQNLHRCLIKTLGNQIKQAAIEEKKELIANEINHPIIDKIINFVEENIDKTLKKFDELKDAI